ncbi:helix-turn-helix domain-containing protein [Actinacidiphila yeochonensis]|uniref:helix-turn-helix domain-containing protein n=1 Tax=Actinacidiphila yeochonensis TaxID=89050 RepID=UPI00056273CF|nr:helix-turn-helix transcriptional regulator [Actinacidiphila yeochonensis]
MIFGATLRQRREARGLTTEDVGRHIGQSASKVSRMENGRHDFKEEDLHRLFGIYGITEQAERERLLHLARKANERGWWDAWSDVSTKTLQTLVSLEDMAQRIRCYEIGQLPGLVQTTDYTRELIRANSPAREAQEAERAVELRAMRQLRFAEAGDRKLLCVLDEVTLVRGYGTRQVMRRQLEHLVALSERPDISLRLVELTRLNLPVQIGTTTIFDFADGRLPDIVYIERPNGGLYLHDESEVDEHVKGFDRLLYASLGHHATVRRIQDHLKKLR